jgi:sporulation protein YlmC with PRC-barrel domain
MAGKKTRGALKKARPEEEEAAAGESGKALAPGSIRVLTQREKDWLPAEPAGPYKAHDELGFGESKEPAGGDRTDPKELLGKRVVDTDGLELGYVDKASEDELTVVEGPFGEWLRIHRNYVGDVGGEVRLLEPLQELLQDVEVVDSAGKSVGWVTDVIATGDVVDGLIVKGPRGNLFVLLEDICSIGGRLTLDITLAALRKQAANRKKGR